MNNAALDELVREADLLAEFELRIARRADELKRMDRGRSPGRDFWQEAEDEIWPVGRVTAKETFRDRS